MADKAREMFTFKNSFNKNKLAILPNICEHIALFACQISQI